MTDKIEIWTDGACSGNPGPGGWGVLIRADGAETELHGGEASTTNNRMELMAAIAALEAHPAGAKIVLHTDSTYVKDGLTKWIINWKRNGWKNAAKEPVKNKDLWVRLDAAAATHKVDWRWVKGHSGHAENDRADALARKGCDEARPKR
jgi:ribonuclease HI